MPAALNSAPRWPKPTSRRPSHSRSPRLGRGRTDPPTRSRRQASRAAWGEDSAALTYLISIEGNMVPGSGPANRGLVEATAAQTQSDRK